MGNMTARPARRGAVLLACSILAACSSASPFSADSSTSVPAEPRFSYALDPSLDAGGGVEVMAAGGASSRFAAGRIVVVFDDPAVLEGIVARYGGRVVRQYATADYGIPGPAVAVVEVDPATADLEALPAAMTGLGADGAAGFGSEAGARLAAIVAVERAAGNRVALDWQTETTAIPQSTLEADTQESAGWVRDAYQLSYYRRDAVQGIGVAEAWSLMYQAGVLDRRVPLAVLDWGFAVDEDFRDPVIYAMDPAAWPFGEPDEEGYYHGYLTAATATAVPDNEYGIAGVAGVVAQPVLIQMDESGLSGYLEGILQAYSMGARIISMSFIAPILSDALPLADALDEVTASLAEAGVLMFASSGNGGGNVDEIAGTGGLYGTRPCQAPGVVCVGGLGDDSVERHEDSTYGNPGGSVDIYAPYCVHGFPPGGTGSVFRLCGTSFSAPFAAGVAALVWASNPALDAAGVWELMESTAAGDRWPRVNAFDAVARALGPFVAVHFLEPAEGSEQDLGRVVTLAARLAIPTDPAVASAPVLVRFTSDRDGLIGEHTWTVPMQRFAAVTEQWVSADTAALSAGDHTITVTASYGGTEASDVLHLSVGNSAPGNLRILQPADGAAICTGSPVTFRGDAYDVNEQVGLPESAFRWLSDRDGSLGTGRNLTVGGLSAGTHRVTLEVTDSSGGVAAIFITLVVRASADASCRDLPPVVTIVAPENGTDFWVDRADAGYEIGSDVQGDYVVVTLQATVSDDHDPAGSLTVDFYVDPEWPDTWVGSGTGVEVRLHLRTEDSLVKEIRVVVYDSAGNRSEDAIRVTANRFH